MVRGNKKPTTNNHNIKRENHVYINFDKKLVEIIDFCTAHIFFNGAKKYTNRKDFVVKSIQNLLDWEKSENSQLKKLLAQIDKEVLVAN